jgi:predicted RNase H-like HicB family nuclease
VDRYGIAIFWSEEDNQFISIAPDLRGCSASGDTYEEALSEIQIAKELWLESSRERDYEVPEPRWRPAEAIQVAD